MFAVIDVRNAFNSAGWANMISPLRNKYNVPPHLLRMVEVYLKDRQLLYDTKDGTQSRKVTAGAATYRPLAVRIFQLFLFFD